MPDNSLWLHPEHAEAVPDRSAVEQCLTEIGFIGDRFSFEDRENYRPGSEFLQLLTFLGCSPVVALGEPGATGDEFCHVELLLTDRTQMIAGDNVKVPRCRACRARIEPWRELLSEAAEAAWHCPHCGAAASPCRLNWRRYAGCGRFFIKVWGIFEGEAVPGAQLMSALERATGTSWDYFYYRAC